MPRTSVVERHPKRREIEQAIVDRRPMRQIAQEYGLSEPSLWRHHDGRMARKLAKAIEKREIADGERMLDKITDIMDKVSKLLEACHEFLQSPEDPEKYDLNAHDSDVIVTCQQLDDETGRPFGERYRMTYDEIRRQLKEYGYLAHNIRYTHADPRNLILQSAKTLEGQMQLLVSMSAELRAQQAADITKHPEWQRLQADLITILRNHPEALEEVQRAFAS